MAKRVFRIDEGCYIIYTGQSSADNAAFLRIGTSPKVSGNIQKHIRYIVVNDAAAVDINMENNDIKFMSPSNIKYICSQQNHIDFYTRLQESGVNTRNFGIRSPSPDMDNINRVEFKKHFFTIFYDNKNVKLVTSEDVFFDLFESRIDKLSKVNDTPRLENFMKQLDALNAECRTKPKFIEETPSVIKPTDKLSAFIIQDDLFTPLSAGMFEIIKITGNVATVLFTNSQRFTVGRPMTLSLLNHADKVVQTNGLITEGTVVESQVMYKFLCNIQFADKNALALFSQFFMKVIS